MTAADYSPVHFDPLTGAPGRVLSRLLRKLSAYTREDCVKNFKIGITNYPERRFSQAYARYYDEMIVLYQTTSIDFVSQIEALLVEHNWEITDNTIAGGGGNIGVPPYFLYVVLRQRRR